MKLKKNTSSNFFNFKIFLIFYSIGLIAETIYLPAIPQMTIYLECQMDQLQAMMGYFFLAYGLSMAFYGPIADLFGRSTTLSIGVTLSLAGALFCCFSSDLEMLSAGIITMGLGLGSAGMLCRTLARDLFDGDFLLKAFSYVSVSFVIAPIMAPILGGLLIKYFIWQSTFFTIFVLLVMSGILLKKYFKETSLPRKMSAEYFLSGYYSLFSNRKYIGLLLIGLMSSGILMAYESASALIYQEFYGFSPLGHAICAAIPTIGTIIGSYLLLILKNKYSLISLLTQASCYCVLVCLFIYILPIFSLLNIYFLVFLLSLLFVLMGIIFSLTTAEAMKSADSRFIGLAASTMGGLHNIGIGFFIKSLVNFSPKNLSDIGFFMLISSIIPLILLIILKKSINNETQESLLTQEIKA